MTQILNFKVMEVTGATKDEAIAKAPFSVMGDATQAFKLWKKKQAHGITEADKKQFMLDYLSKKSKNVAGVGFVITQEAAVADTRERPYRIEDVKNESGSRTYVTVYQIIDKATGAVIVETPVKHVQDKDKNGNLLFNEDGSPKMVWKSGTKAQAKEYAKALYTENDFRGDLICKYTKQVVEGEATAFTVTYTPSKNSKVGTYTVFGIEA